MWAVLPYLVPLGITFAANLGVTRRFWRWLTYSSLALAGLVACVTGLLLMGTPALVRASPQAGLTDLFNTTLFGLLFIGTGLLGLLCLLAPVRRALARVLHIDPDSPVDTTALVFALYLAVSSLSLLFLPQTAVLNALDSANVSSATLVYGEAVMLVFALVGVGLGTRRDLRQVLVRLGLKRPSWKDLAVAGGLIVGFLALDYAVSVIWYRLWPQNYQAISNSTQRLFAGFDSIPGALVLGLSAGIGEESLFRGALQPRLRIVLTAILFTLGHVQYALSPALAEILVIGLVLGWLRERTNTTTCMVTHAGYNFLDSVLARFFP